MQNNTVSLSEVFVSSRIGMVVAAIEFMVVCAIFALLMTIITLPLSIQADGMTNNPLLLNRDIMYILMSVIGGIFGLFFGSLIKRSLFLWKIFPPSEKRIDKFKKRKVEELNNIMKENENRIVALSEYNKELKGMIEELVQ